MFDQDKMGRDLLAIEYEYNMIIREIAGEAGDLSINLVYKESDCGGNPYMAADLAFAGDFDNLITYSPCSMTYGRWIAEIKAYLFDKIYMNYA